MAPPDPQGSERIEQHARHLPEDAGRGHRHGDVGRDHRGVAEGRAFPRTLTIDQSDGKSFAPKAERDADANDAGADHGDVHGLFRCRFHR